MSEREPPAATAMSIDTAARRPTNLSPKRATFGRPLPSDMPRAMARIIDSSILSPPVAAKSFVGYPVCVYGDGLRDRRPLRFHRPDFVGLRCFAHALRRAFYAWRGLRAVARRAISRADFLYRNWSVRAQGVIDLTLFLLFYFPAWRCFCGRRAEFFIEAAQRGERLDDTAWRPYAAPRARRCGRSFVFVDSGRVRDLEALYAVMRGKRAR